MPAFTREDASAFLKAMRLTLHGKVGFKWLVERLSGLEEYIEATAAENERLNAYIDWSGSRADFESYTAAHPPTPDGDEAAARSDSETPVP